MNWLKILLASLQSQTSTLTPRLWLLEPHSQTTWPDPGLNDLLSLTRLESAYVLNEGVQKI